jgi:hypothetical protein
MKGVVKGDKHMTARNCPRVMSLLCSFSIFGYIRLIMRHSIVFLLIKTIVTETISILSL